MKKKLLMAALAAAVVGGALGCGGGKGTQVKPAPASNAVAAATDTVAYAPDTDTTFTDKRDGKVYRIVEIGGAVWMAENLNYAAEGSKCYENKVDSCAKYGCLYNWKTALTVCPAGFHLPSDDEWTALENAVGGENIAGTKLKSAAGWNEGGNGTNDFGWSALPGGFGIPGDYRYAGSASYWWSATEIDAHYSWSRYADHYAWSRYVDYLNESMGRISNDKAGLFSVRCVQDKEGEQ